MNEKLVIDNIPLIHLVIKKLNLTWTTEDEFQDYYDAGLDGLIDGAKTFDETKGFTQATYLYTCIKNRITRYLYLKTMPKRCNPNGRDISIDTKIGDEESKTISEIIPDPNVNIAEDLEKKLEIERLMYAVNHLENETDKEVLKMYWGLEGKERMTYKAIATQLGVTHQMIQQRIRRCYPKLKEYLRKNDKEVFMLEQNKQVPRTIEQTKTDNNNTLLDLNRILFDQLNALNNTDADLEKEMKKACVVVQLAQQITNNANTILKAANLTKETESNKNAMKLIGISNDKS